MMKCWMMRLKERMMRMKFNEIFDNLQRDNRSLIRSETFFGTIPSWFTKLNFETLAKTSLDRYYLEQTYGNSECVVDYGGALDITVTGIMEKNRYKFDNLYRTTIQDYNPIDNYDRTEETDVVLNGSNSNTSVSESNNVKTGSETDNTTGTITNTKTGSETDNTTGSISNTKSGNTELAKTGTMLEESMDSGTETHTQNVNTETTTQSRAFNSGLIDTAKSKTATPSANTDILSFDNRKNLKSTGYNGYKETETYNDVTEISNYDNLNHVISHNVTDTSTHNLKRETAFNNVTDTNNQTSTAEGTVSNSTKTTSKIHGNIGVTTTAQMLEGERELSEFDFIDVVYRTVIGELSCGFVVPEEGYYDN